jgi:type VI secretion system protein ImpA
VDHIATHAGGDRPPLVVVFILLDEGREFLMSVAVPINSAEILDVEALLTPIAGENPAGENLQYAGLYDEVRKERRADEDVAQGDWRKSDTKSANWNQVVKLTTEAISTTTKDLQAGAWLTEALVKLHGFVGLRDGLKLMRGLHERFWDHVYPEADEDGFEGRANSLAWLSSQLARSVKEVLITNASGRANYSYFQWNESEEFDIPEKVDSLDAEAQERINELKQRATTEGKVTSEEWRKAKQVTRRAFYEETCATLDECWEELQALDREMDEKFGRDTPGLGELSKSLDEVRSLVQKIVKEKRILEPDEPEYDDALSEHTNGEDVGTSAFGSSTGPIKTRQEGFRRLAEVSEYFRRTEPHSPVSYLVERAVRWGRMPLEAWLEDVIKEVGVLDNLRETLGLKTSSNGGNGEENSNED